MSEERLIQDLVKVLDWDRDFVADAVNMIVTGQPHDVQDMIENVMGNNPEARKVIEGYLAGKTQVKPAVPQSPPPKSMPAKEPADMGMFVPRMVGNVKQQPDKGQEAPEGFKAKTKGGMDEKYSAKAKAGSKDPREKDAAPGGAGPGRSQQEGEGPNAALKAAEAQLAMFKKGGKIRQPAPRPAAAAGGSRRDDQNLAGTAALERKVVNCLGCGKIFDCRSVSNDIIRFLDTGGACTFCGTKVSLTYRDRGQDGAGPEAAKAGAGGTGTAGAVDEVTAAAIAFKDRLVEYDRNSAKRTTVIDDQSDFFEIDSNAWLTDQEREEMRKRRQVEAEAEAARRRRVTVTLDLLGRRVLVADGADGPGISFESPPAAGGAAAAAGGEGAKAEGAAATAADPTGEALQKELGTVARKQAEAQAQRAATALRELRITCNPNISTPAPIFVPSASVGAHSRTAPATPALKGSTGSAKGAAATGKQQQQQQPNGASAAAASTKRRRPKGPLRLQDDFNEFDEFLEQDLMAEFLVVGHDGAAAQG